MRDTDENDRRLIAHLATNARMSITQLAQALGMARSTVQARLERLENAGIIAGYALRLGDATRATQIRATVLLQVEPRATAAIVPALERMPAVLAAHTTTGRFDLVLELAERDTEAMDRLLDQIGALKGVRGMESLIQLRTRIDRRF